MGWTASEDPFATIQLSFPTLSSAVDYAERMGLDCRVHEPAPRRPVSTNYPNTGPRRHKSSVQLRQGAKP